MGQSWTEDVYSTGPAATDLQNIENNFATINTMRSGTTAPAQNTYTGTPWYDTAKKLLKIKVVAGGAWRGVMMGNASTPIFMYVNAAPDGWIIFGSLSDKILAVKGGSYGATGGIDSQGSWTISAHTLPNHRHTISLSHNHKWYDNNAVNTYDSTYNAGGSSYILTAGSVKSAVGKGHLMYSTAWADSAPDYPIADGWTSTYVGGSNTGYYQGTLTNNHGSTWRPAAAVGIMVVPNI